LADDIKPADAVKVSVEGPVELKSADAVAPGDEKPVVQKTAESKTTITRTGTPPPDVASHNEVTRREIVYMIFIQWNVLILSVLGAMIFKGWEISPVTGNIIMIALTNETSLLVAVGAFYLGMQYQTKSQQE
jgi:hypothetical protein